MLNRKKYRSTSLFIPYEGKSLVEVLPIEMLDYIDKLLPKSDSGRFAQTGKIACSLGCNPLTKI